jgi:hypothetical protein
LEDEGLVGAAEAAAEEPKSAVVGRAAAAAGEADPHKQIKTFK